MSREEFYVVHQTTILQQRYHEEDKHFDNLEDAMDFYEHIDLDALLNSKLYENGFFYFNWENARASAAITRLKCDAESKTDWDFEHICEKSYTAKEYLEKRNYLDGKKIYLVEKISTTGGLVDFIDEVFDKQNPLDALVSTCPDSEFCRSTNGEFLVTGMYFHASGVTRRFFMYDLV